MLQDDLVEVLIRASSPLFWRCFKEDRASEKQWRAIEHDFDRDHIPDRLQAKEFADQYASIANRHIGSFWRARHYLMENLPAAAVNLPTPDTDPAGIDPDIAARSVREALSMLSGRPAKASKRDRGSQGRCIAIYLDAWKMGKPLTVMEIAKKAGCHKSTASRAIRPLERDRKAGFEPIPGDRRRGRKP
jgi:hypothetical protein